jgi:hypothetical protein
MRVHHQPDELDPSQTNIKILLHNKQPPLRNRLTPRQLHEHELQSNLALNTPPQVTLRLHPKEDPANNRQFVWF